MHTHPPAFSVTKPGKAEGKLANRSTAPPTHSLSPRDSLSNHQLPETSKRKAEDSMKEEPKALSSGVQILMAFHLPLLE